MGRHIGLVGPKHSGKTTAAEYLVNELGYNKIALADPLKNNAVSMINTFNREHGLPEIDRAFLDAHKDEVFVPFLQWLGTEYGRKFLRTPERWINVFLNESYASTFPVVCDDIRFPNEADTLRENGFLIVKLVRDEGERQESLLRSGVPSDVHAHASETELEKIVPDIIVYTDTGVRKLCAAVLWCTSLQTRVAEFYDKQSRQPYFVYTGEQLHDDIKHIAALVQMRSSINVALINPKYKSIWETFQSLTD
jgi:hypothetical protein